MLNAQDRQTQFTTVGSKNSDEDLHLKNIIQSLLQAVSYVSPRDMMSAGSSSNALRSALDAEINSWALPATSNTVFDSGSTKAASVVEVFLDFICVSPVI